ncbi:hypothetical protein E4K67_05255 [Desulfosporosinus fructosivorans]|uniref:FlxA protein n=1 Tax=Desulfosporosinus fructosivorans TaxID=2018669 RepID=A0A4Z0R8W3_9FIRM|nr:FlxA-like family protein [Desulfosporosinus fructosivorans]TGE38884.1 hypothetical protein E4K67_05255 [Desulfosporosinus fructosivorans]
MNVSSVSSISSSSYSSGNDTDEKRLSDQVKQLQNQINTVTQSKDDAKTKQAKIQLLEAQIIQIQAQIQANSKKTNQNSNTETQQATQIQAVSTSSKLDIQV